VIRQGYLGLARRQFAKLANFMGRGLAPQVGNASLRSPWKSGRLTNALSIVCNDFYSMGPPRKTAYRRDGSDNTDWQTQSVGVDAAALTAPLALRFICGVIADVTDCIEVLAAIGELRG
jgi:hypothetical protein